MNDVFCGVCVCCFNKYDVIIWRFVTFFETEMIKRGLNPLCVLIIVTILNQHELEFGNLAMYLVECFLFFIHSFCLPCENSKVSHASMFVLHSDLGDGNHGSATHARLVYQYTCKEKAIIPNIFLQIMWKQGMPHTIKYPIFPSKYRILLL